MEEKEIVLEETKEDVKVETSEKKSGSNKVLIVIIVILLLIIAVGFGYFLGSGKSNSNGKEADKVVDKNKEEEKIENTDKDDAEEVKIEQLTKDSAVVKKLYDVFKEVEKDMYDPTVDYDLSKDNVKKSIAVKELVKENKISERTCGSLSDFYVEDALCFPFETVYNDNGVDRKKTKEASKNNKAMVFTPSDLKAKYKELYGQNADYKDESFDLTTFVCAYAYYDKTNNLYARYSYGCSGTVAVDATQTLDSIKQEGTSLVLYTTLKEVEKPAKKIEYAFEFEKATGNYIFVSRTVK